MMGDSISIQFRNKDAPKERRLSVVLSSHWDGLDFKRLAKQYVAELKKDPELKKTGSFYPLGRREPDVVMIDFIRWLTVGGGRVLSNYRIAATTDYIDNSDNGHHIIDLV